MALKSKWGPDGHHKHQEDDDNDEADGTHQRPHHRLVDGQPAATGHKKTILVKNGMKSAKQEFKAVVGAKSNFSSTECGKYTVKLATLRMWTV